MKYLITESKIREVALKWLDVNFSPDNLEINEYPDNTYGKHGKDVIHYEKDGEIIITWYKNKNRINFHNRDIWDFFENFLGISFLETKSLMKTWLENNFNSSESDMYVLYDNKWIKL